jgi:hypothetical protein
MFEQIPSVKLEEALRYTDEQLFELIGTINPVGNIRGNPKKLVGYGKACWNKLEVELRPTISQNSVVQHVANRTSLDIAEAVYAALLPELSVELAVYASALIVRSGISNWCDPIWRDR